MKKNFLLLGAAAMLASTAYGQKDTVKTAVLDDVTITANKVEQKQSSTGKVVTVITRQQLENNTGRTLAQVLNEQAGLIINGSQNTLGTSLSVFMRGSTTANTLILVDGVPANDPSVTEGFFDLNYFAIDQIERVEILKGSQSVLYGSDAVAGVINIITKKTNGSKPFNVNAVAAAGTYGTYKGAAGIGGKTKMIDYNLNYSHLQSDGFSAAYDEADTSNFEKDGFNQDVIGGNFTLKPLKDLKLRLFGEYSKYKTDIDDGAFADDKNNTLDNENIQAGLAGTYKFSKATVNLNLNLNNTDRKTKDEVNNPVGVSDYDPSFGNYKGETLFGELYTNIQLHKHWGLLAGVDVRNQKANIETTYGKLGNDSLHTTQTSAYASLSLQSLKGFSAELGGRYTNHSTFGSSFTYSFNPSYLISKEVKLFVNISSAFRAPSVYQIASEYGNKDLKPEKTNSIEGGVQFTNTANTINLRATYFNLEIKDVIIFKSLFVPPYGQYDNADKQHDNGLELEASIHFCKQLTLTANYTYVTGEIDTKSSATGKDTTYFNLIRRPKNAVNATFGYTPISKLYISIGGRWVDSRQDQFFDPTTYATEQKKLADYYNLDAYISFQPISHLKLFVDLRNITDQKYFDLYGYNTRRFNMVAGVTVNF